MLFYTAIVLLAILNGQVEPFKFGHTKSYSAEVNFQPPQMMMPLPPPPPPPQPEQHFQMPLAPQPLAPPAQPQALAYVRTVIIRPIYPQQQYQYLEPSRYNRQPAELLPLPAEEPLRHQPTKGGYEAPAYYSQQQESLQATKGGFSSQQFQEQLPAEPIQQEQLEQQAAYAAPAATPIAVASPATKGAGKLSKLKSHFDKFIDSARSKLAFSSYEVVSEELITPPPPPPPAQPLEQQQVQQAQEEISLTKQEQETIRDTEQQEIQQGTKQQELPQQQQQVEVQEDKKQAQSSSGLKQQQQQQVTYEEAPIKAPQQQLEVKQTRLSSTKQLTQAPSELPSNASPKGQ